MNGTVIRNQLIYDFASGILGPAKSLFASTYLQLNSNKTVLKYLLVRLKDLNFNLLNSLQTLYA